MRVTDEIVGRASGWHRVSEKKTHPKSSRLWWTHPRLAGGPVMGYGSCPPFTTSLDTIVKEVEAGGWWWKCGSGIVIGGKKNEAYFAVIHGGPTFYAETAPLALCRAWVAYRKKEKRP